MNPMNITCCASFNAGCGTEINTPVYSPMNEYLAAEEILERKIRDLFGPLDPVKMNRVKTFREECQVERISKAEAKAIAMLKEANRPLCFLDMLCSLDRAIIRYVYEFERRNNLLTASRFLALLKCKEFIEQMAEHGEIACENRSVEPDEAEAKEAENT